MISETPKASHVVIAAGRRSSIDLYRPVCASSSLRQPSRRASPAPVTRPKVRSPVAIVASGSRDLCASKRKAVPMYQHRL